jgi:hypothetical protein
MHSHAHACMHMCRYVVSTDKDRKVRVSLMPPNPMAGSVEIQSYCLGHRHFVTSSAFVVQGGASAGATMVVTGVWWGYWFVGECWGCCVVRVGDGVAGGLPGTPPHCDQLRLVTGV